MMYLALVYNDTYLKDRVTSYVLRSKSGKRDIVLCYSRFAVTARLTYVGMTPDITLRRNNYDSQYQMHHLKGYFTAYLAYTWSCE